MKAHKTDEPLGVIRYMEQAEKGLPHCVQESLAARLQAHIKAESAAKPYAKLKRRYWIDDSRL